MHQGAKMNKKGAQETLIVDDINPIYIYIFHPGQGGILWSYTYLFLFY